MLSPPERQLRARLAAHTRWANAGPEERQKQAQIASRGLLAKFEREVDPDGVLEPTDRLARAKSARSAYMARLALQRSRKSRGNADV